MKKNKKVLLSLIFSFYNEENNIPILIDRVEKHFRILLNEKLIQDYEIIFVNDNSNDKSENLINTYIKKNKRIKLINMSRNFGNSECTLAGFKYSKGDIVVYMDSDLQDPPELIGTMINAWRNDPETEVVYTTRTKRRGENFFKLLITKFGYRFIKNISDIDLPIDSGDFKLLSRRVVDEVLNLRESKPYLRGLISYVGFKQTQIFYERETRNDGQQNTKYPVLTKRVIYGYLDRAMISFSDAPLKITFFLGIFLLFLSLIYIFFIVYSKFNYIVLPGWTAMMVAITFFGSINIILIGILGLYIGSIFNESKKRPSYIIKNTKNIK